jgi:hypothetical protein
MLAEHLGRPMASTGKAAAMETACADQSCGVKFNKYSGVAEWQNACMLWVNVGGSDYNNEFLLKVSNVKHFSRARPEIHVSQLGFLTCHC